MFICIYIYIYIYIGTQLIFILTLIIPHSHRPYFSTHVLLKGSSVFLQIHKIRSKFDTRKMPSALDRLDVWWNLVLAHSICLLRQETDLQTLLHIVQVTVEKPVCTDRLA